VADAIGVSRDASSRHRLAPAVLIGAADLPPLPSDLSHVAAIWIFVATFAPPAGLSFLVDLAPLAEDFLASNWIFNAVSCLRDWAHGNSAD